MAERREVVDALVENSPCDTGAELAAVRGTRCGWPGVCPGQETALLQAHREERDDRGEASN